MRKFAVVVALCMTVASGCALAGEKVEMPNPLKNLKAGQWVHYRINTLFGIAEQKQTVVSVQGEGDDRLITIKSEMSIDGEVVDEQEDTVTFKAALQEQEESLNEAENVEYFAVQTDVKGEQIPAVRVDFTQDGQTCHLYMSERIPLVGMIRLLVDGMDEPAMELLDFGE